MANVIVPIVRKRKAPMTTDEQTEVAALVDKLSANGKVDILFYSGPIEHLGYQALEDQCQVCSGEDAILYITTEGGSADVGFKIAKLLQLRYKKFSVFISDYCKSAGTLVAIGADELIFSPSGELGPLDIQLRKMEELGEEYMSGLDTMAAINALNFKSLEAFRTFLVEIRTGGQLSTEVASRMATELVTGLYSNIYRQIEPLKLGSVSRLMQIAAAYGSRLNKKSKNLKAKALAKLVSGYPSHSFAILCDEANDLFHNVRLGSDVEMKLADFIRHLEESSRVHPDRDEYDDSIMVACINHIAQALKEKPDDTDDDDSKTKGEPDAKPDASPYPASKDGGETGAGGDPDDSQGTKPANH